MKTLDHEFNALVMRMASRIPYYLTDEQTASYEDMRREWSESGRLAINTGFSDNTIFGAPEVNFAFRAWHDHCHILANADFSAYGERRAAKLQTQQMWEAMRDRNYSQASWFSRLIDCEVNGQVKYFETFADFPADQYQFAVNYLSGRMERV